MGKLFGFEYSRTCRLSTEYVVHCILESHKNQYWMNCFYNGQRWKTDITDKIEEICKKLDEANLESWNFKSFSSELEMDPPLSEWKLSISTDTLCIRCNGDSYPEGFENIMDIMGYMGCKKY